MSDSIQRNPHPDFKGVEASRPDWEADTSFHYTKTPQPGWTFGSGENQLGDSKGAAGDKGEAKDKAHVVIDPQAADRPGPANYKLLISAIVPRPIAFVSTRSADGQTTNLAPFSYFNLINHDPPLFVVGFALGVADAKDTLRNILETKECVINLISEPFAEAANATSINAPYGASEWAVSGLTPVHDCRDVRCARVGEAVVSIEARLDFFKEYDSRKTEGKKSGVVGIFEGTRFWVREDALNQDQTLIDPAVLRPVSRLGGITYGRTTQAFELLRPQWENSLGGQEGFDKLKAEKESS